MPSNKQQLLELQCRRNIDQLLTKALPSLGELSFINVVREAVLQFPVGTRFVKSFIEEFYIEPGLVVLKDGIIYPGEGSK